MALRWDQKVDVAVVGSGGAGLTAAILAHDNGARVVVLERTDKVGGTTAVSGGVVWVPLNHHMQEVGATDSREEALALCKYLTGRRSLDEMVETYVDTAPQMLRYMEEHTPVAFSHWQTPDYHAEAPGGKLIGRTLEPVPFDTTQLGEWRDKLRPGPLFLVPITMDEMLTKHKILINMDNFPTQLVEQRMEQGKVVCGMALAGALLKGCLDRKIPIILESRARRLIREDGRVVGVALEREGKDFLVRAHGGVVLACAGFEWNEEMREKFLPGPLTHPQSPPFNEGDGLVMAMEVGADLANMTEAWWIPSGVVVGEEYEGKGLSRFIVAERNLPHTIMVNRLGERFVNEGATYNEMGRVFHQFDPNIYGHPNLPCWLVFDRQYRERYPLMTVMPGDPDPEWLERDETLEGLGLKVGIDPQRLQATVNRWNGFVHQDRDLDFNRGQRAIERYYGDPGYREPNFGTIEKPPYYALPLYSGALGTKGGPRINVKGQVLNVRGEVIGGLYGAGNVVASPAGPAYWAGGGTIGPAMTWGYICGTNAAKEAKGAVD